MEVLVRLTSKIATEITVLALSASPALAQSPQGSPSSHRGIENKPATPGRRASAKSKAKAYSKHCKGQSKKHVNGQKGTPFSQCVTAMAQLANGKTKSPRAACRNLRHKRVEGEKGTPFSRCVSGDAKLLHDQA